MNRVEKYLNHGCDPGGEALAAYLATLPELVRACDRVAAAHCCRIGACEEARAARSVLKTLAWTPGAPDLRLSAMRALGRVREATPGAGCNLDLSAFRAFIEACWVVDDAYEPLWVAHCCFRVEKGSPPHEGGQICPEMRAAMDALRVRTDFVDSLCLIHPPWPALCDRRALECCDMGLEGLADRWEATREALLGLEAA